MKEKKALFIDYFFPLLAADWRGTAFCKLLPEFGWQPIVISPDESESYDKDYDLLGENQSSQRSKFASFITVALLGLINRK